MLSFVKKERGFELCADEIENANEIVDFFKNSEFDAELLTAKGKSMSGHVMEIQYIKITRKGW